MPVPAYVCDQLAAWGIDRVFGVSGANIELIFDAAVRHTAVDAVLAKQEGSATTMAMGWQERAGRPGVVVTTSGGAAFNIVPPLTEALDSEIPLLALVGQSPTTGEGRGAFQDSSGPPARVDALRILGAASVHAERVSDSERVPGALHDALAAAVRDRGPAVVLLPRDVQTGTCSGALVAFPGPRAGPVVGASPLLVHRLNAAITGEAPPLIIAGHHALAPAPRAALLRVLDAWDAALAVAPDANSLLPSGDPRMLGIAGVMGHDAVVDYARRTNVIVLAGTRLPDTCAYGLADALATATIVSCNERPCFPGLEGHWGTHELGGPLAATLEHLRDSTVVRTGPAPRRDGPRRGPSRQPARGAEPLTARAAIDVIARHLVPDTDVFIDAGNAGAFAIHHLGATGRGLRSMALGMGAMGHAFGAAIGACEHTGRRTYVVAGDGAFYMSGMEIHTALQRCLPVTFLIINNNAHAMCRLREQRLLPGPTGANAFGPAYPANGFGAMFPGVGAAEARTADELDQAIARFADRPGPAIVSVTTPTDEPPPFWPLATPRYPPTRPAPKEPAP